MSTSALDYGNGLEFDAPLGDARLVARVHHLRHILRQNHKACQEYIDRFVGSSFVYVSSHEPGLTLYLQFASTFNTLLYVLH